MPQPQRRPRQGRCRPRLERLEDRLTPTGVFNVPPRVGINGLPEGVLPEGTPVDLGSDVFDPGLNDNPQVAWRVTRDGIVFAAGAGSRFRFTPDDEGTYVVTATATDKD